VHTAPLIEQVPVFGQSVFTLHESPVTLQLPASGVHCATVVQAVPLFALWPHTALWSHAALLPKPHDWPTLPCVHVPAVPAHVTPSLPVVQDAPLFEHVPFLAHCAVLPLTVQAAPTFPVEQVPFTWHVALAPFVVQTVVLGCPAVQWPTTLHCAAVVHGVAGGARLFVHVPTRSQSVLRLHDWPSFALLVHVLPPTAGHCPLALQLVAAFEHTPVNGQSVAAFEQLVPTALLQCGPIAGQLAALLQAALGGLLQVPLLAMTGQFALVVQVVPVVMAQFFATDGHVPGFE